MALPSRDEWTADWCVLPILSLPPLLVATALAPSPDICYLLLAIIVPTATYVALFLTERHAKGAVLARLPGPRSFPVVGALFEMRKQRSRLSTYWRLDLAKQHGKVFGHPLPIWVKSPRVV